MEAHTRHPARHLALGVTCASGLIVLAAGAAALWTPGDLGLSTTRTPSGQALVQWVAPNGPAWSADILPGDHIVGWNGVGPLPLTLRARSGSQTHLLRTGTTTPTLLHLLIAALGLAFLAIGALVLGKSSENGAAWALWRFCVLAGLALGVAAAGIHGLGWALAIEFVALRLLGPALLELALLLPIGAEALPWVAGWRRAVLWLAPAVLLALYPFCWLWPARLFTGVQLAGGLVLIGAIIAAGGHLLTLRRQPLSEAQRAQLRYVAIGVVGGFTPLLLCALLPDLLVRHPLAPPEVLIWALVLFPLGVGAAIVRHEFLGIPSLLYRRTLHLMLHGLLLVIVALIVGLLLVPGSQQGGWTRATLAVGATVLLVLLVTQWARLAQKAERVLLPDAYDPMKTRRRMHEQMFLTEVHERSTALLREVGDNLDLRFALLQTAPRHYVQGHPREPQPIAVLEAVTQRAQVLLTTSPAADAAESWVEQIEGLPVRLMPLRDREKTVRAILCIGPKHCGDTFTPQDEEMLAMLHDDLEAPFFYQQADAPVMEENETGDEEQAENTSGDVWLTRLQRTVLLYLDQGLSTAEIAERLGRSVKTVQDRLRIIYNKLGVHTRQDAVRVARQKGLLPPRTSAEVHAGSEAPEPPPPASRDKRGHAVGPGEEGRTSQMPPP